jgi:small GTP-binding protein
MVSKGGADGVIKIKMIGDSGVGKTSIIMRYTEGTFTENTQATIGVDYKNSMINVQGKKIKLVIWDTAGQDKYRTLTSAYYKGTNGLCVVYDVASRESFENLDRWLKEFHENSSESDIVQTMLIGNKTDLEGRQVTTQEAEFYAKKNSMLFTEVSAKHNKGINDIFTELANKVLENNPSIANPYVTPGGPQGTKLTEASKPEDKQGGCC